MVLMSISICAPSTNMILNGLTNRERERERNIGRAQRSAEEGNARHHTSNLTGVNYCLKCAEGCSGLATTHA